MIPSFVEDDMVFPIIFIMVVSVNISVSNGFEEEVPIVVPPSVKLLIF